jgi:hypothetical protein
VVLIEALVALGVLLAVGVGLPLLLNTLISKVLETRASRTLVGRIASRRRRSKSTTATCASSSRT